MNPFIALAITAVGALVTRSASAEYPEGPESNVPSGGLAAERDDGAELVRALVFAVANGPGRPLDAPLLAGEIAAQPTKRFAWVSPVFVWIEPGYAYIETELSF